MKTIRVQRLCKEMKTHGIDQMIIASKANIYYFTGAYIDPMHRLLALIINADGSSQYYVNRLFSVDPSVQSDLIFWDDTEDPIQMIGKSLRDGATVAIDHNWPARFLLKLMAAQPNAKYINDPQLIDNLRAIKDYEEIMHLECSSRINDMVMEELLSQISANISEEKFSRMRYDLFAEHSANAYGCNCIFSYGSHCAEPHHVPDATLLHPCDSIMVDMGAPYHYYYSDMTRTVFYKNVSPEMERIYDTVLNAHIKASEAIKPGVPCSQIDKIARDIITSAGYGTYFNHRTGHGIGLDTHEFPDISQSCEKLLEPGMVFSVEPGIYIPGKGGVRIENLFVCTEEGHYSLNHLSRELTVVG